MTSQPGGSKRLLALDVMRGITVAAMIVVNNAGGPQSYQSLRHSAWNGLTPCDLVFPFFLFIVGITTFLSLSGKSFSPSWTMVRKILGRATLIILIGWALHWLEMAVKGRPFDFGQLRLTGVLPRIGLCYGIVALLSLKLSVKAMARAAAVLLAVYTALLCAFNGYCPDASNINALVDRFLLGSDHLYHKSPVDPEGITATLAAVAHTMVGFCCGAIVKNGRPLSDRLLTLAVVGFALLALGYLLSEWLPLNKRIWSPTFVLCTTGCAALTLTLLSAIIDLHGYRRWTPFFESFGVNPLFLYVLAEILATLASRTGTKSLVYASIESVIPNPCLASAVYSLAFMLLAAAAGWPLYRRRIYIKI